MKTTNSHTTMQRYATFTGITIREVYCPEYGFTVDVFDSNTCHCGSKIN